MSAKGQRTTHAPLNHSKVVYNYDIENTTVSSTKQSKQQNRHRKTRQRPQSAVTSKRKPTHNNEHASPTGRSHLTKMYKFHSNRFKNRPQSGYVRRGYSPYALHPPRIFDYSSRDVNDWQEPGTQHFFPGAGNDPQHQSQQSVHQTPTSPAPSRSAATSRQQHRFTTPNPSTAPRSSRQRPQSAQVSRNRESGPRQHRPSSAFKSNNKQQHQQQQQHSQTLKYRPASSHGRQMIKRPSTAASSRSSRSPVSAISPSTRRRARQRTGVYEANRPHTPAPSSWQPVKQGTIANIPYRKLNVPGFTSAEQLGLVELGQRVFRAKCLDINVPMSRDKEERFVRLFCQRCTSGVVGLHVLNASNMKLGLFALREICEYLVDDNLYTHLYLGGNNFGDTGARLLYELLSVNHVIEVLDVKATGMGQQGMVMLCAAVAQPESVIHTLNASSSGKSEGRNYLGIDGAQALGELLSVSETLQKLSLQNCGLVTEAVPGFVRGLKANDSLLTLDLSTNDLAHRNFPKVCQGLRTCKHLTSLSLANNMLGSTGAMTLAKVLRGMETLKTLDLRQNSIGLRGFALLSDSFSRLVNLEAFLVDDNLFAEQSRMAIDKITLEDYKRREEINLAARRVGIYDKRLSSHISFATALRTISLSKSRVSDGLVVDLFATLNKTTTLQTVHLSGNLISDEGAIAMADFLRINTSLTLLNVSDNQIGDIGGYQMSVALLQNPALTKLSLAVNNVGKRTCEALIDVLSRHRIFHVSLQGNPIPFQELRRAQVLSAQNLTTYQENSHLRFKKEVDILKNQQMRLRKVLVKVEEAAVEEVEIERELEQCKGVSFKFRQEQKEETRRGEDDLKAVMTEAREQMEMEYHAGHAVVNKNREMEARITHMKRMIEKENRGKQSLTRKLKIARQDFDRVRDENANFISGLFKENENEKKERMMVKRVLGKVIDQCETFIFQMETRVSASVRDDKRRKANSYKSRGVDSKTDGSNDSDYGHSFDTNTDDNQEGAKKKKGAGLKKRGKKGKKKTKTPRGEGSEVYQLKLQGDQNAKRKKKGKKRK